MNAAWLPAICGVLLAMLFLAALVAHALRSFSRSRLFQLCEARGRLERFGRILAGHADALLAAELLLLAIGSAWLAVAIVWLELTHLDGVLSSPLRCTIFVLSWLGVFCVLALAVVVLPWTIARVGGERVLLAFWPLVRLATFVLRPLVVLAHKFDGFLHRAVGRAPQEADGRASLVEELRTVVDEGHREGLIEPLTRTMIHRVVELQDEDTAAVMTPRTEMVCIDAAAALEDARRTLLAAGYSRVPVIGENTDDIVGILYARDLLEEPDRTGAGRALREIVREPFYVPETTGVDNLLEMMKRQRVHMAIVVDEYGGVAGLVTLEDVLEEIVGEIEDEFDEAEGDGIKRVSPTVTEVEARVHIDDLNEQLNSDLPEDGDYDTLGGFVFARLGRVPANGDSFDWQNLRVTVLEADERQIHRVRLEQRERQMLEADQAG